MYLQMNPSSYTLVLIIVSKVFGGEGRKTVEVDRLQPNTFDVQFPCTADKIYPCSSNGCANCKIQRQCKNGESQFTNCVSTQVCNVNTCTPKELASSCSCASKPDGSYIDPYNPKNYFVCVNKQENFFSCPPNTIFSPVLEACFALPDCTALGCFEVPEDCQAFYCCQKNGTGFTQQIDNCQQNEVYDQVLSACLSLDPPICTGAGPVVDPYKYNIYFICSGVGDLNPTPYCCPSGQIYSSSIFSCIPDDGSSPNIGSCYSSQRESSYCN